MWQLYIRMMLHCMDAIVYARLMHLYTLAADITLAKFL